MEQAIKTSDVFYALNAPAIEIYRSHLEGTGKESLIRDSNNVHVFKHIERANLNGVAWQLRARHNTPVDVLSGKELREIEPAISTEYQAAILIKDQERAMLPARLGAVLAEKFQSLGGRILQGAVRQLIPRETIRWKLDTELGALLSDNIVLAAGAWSTQLLTPLGIDIPLVAERGYHLTFRNPGVTLNNSIMETDRLFVCSSMENGVRSAGTSEFAKVNATPNYNRAHILKKLTRRLFPDINTDQTEEWMGARPSLPDNLPCIGKINAMEGLFAAFGHSHWGMSMAPNTGRIIADLVNGLSPDVDVSPYKADRFS